MGVSEVEVHLLHAPNNAVEALERDLAVPLARDLDVDRDLEVTVKVIERW